MVFSSLIFLCGFLPVTILGYRLLPHRLRNPFLLLMSLLFYAWGEPIYILLMLFSITVNYCGGLGVGACQRRGKEKGARWVLTATIVVNLALLCFFKYTDFLIESVNHLTGAGWTLLRLALPIGISFYTFQALSYVIDVKRGTVQVQRNWIDFAMYVTLFPQLIAGPIVRYADVEQEMRTRDESAHLFASGIYRFCIGFGKKALLANQAGKLWETVSAEMGTASALTAWLGAIAFTFQIYFDFSGYSDMAIGMGQMFGFRFPENFRYPYIATSITDFWRRWHITLSTWFREYVYIPLGGNRKGRGRQIFNLLIVWALTGLWHGAGWNFLLWGLYFFFLLVLEKTVLHKVLQRCPAPLQHLYTLLLIVFGWVLFASNDFTFLQTFCKALFGANGWCAGEGAYLLTSYGLLLLCMGVAATPVPTTLANALCRKQSESVTTVLQTVWSACLLVLSLSAIIADSYNPFLYFRF